MADGDEDPTLLRLSFMRSGRVEIWAAEEQPTSVVVQLLREVADTFERGDANRIA